MVYAFGEFELDPRVYELRQAGNPCPVEPQVFDVLVYLVRNRDRVVSKEELLDRLWPDRIASETTLTSRLKEARKVLGDSGKRQEIIRTHHGRGYRFVASVEERGKMATSSLVGCVSGDHLVPASSDTHGVLDSFLYKADDPKAHGVRADFVGRRMELDRLDAALRRAAAGSRQIVFVTGEGGAGKTTLVETFFARTGSGLLIARGQCVEHRGSGEAYMPLLDSFDRVCRELFLIV